LQWSQMGFWYTIQYTVANVQPTGDEGVGQHLGVVSG